MFYVFAPRIWYVNIKTLKIQFFRNVNAIYNSELYQKYIKKIEIWAQTCCDMLLVFLTRILIAFLPFFLQNKATGCHFLSSYYGRDVRWSISEAPLAWQPFHFEP